MELELFDDIFQEFSTTQEEDLYTLLDFLDKHFPDCHFQLVLKTEEQISLTKSKEVFDHLDNLISKTRVQNKLCTVKSSTNDLTYGIPITELNAILLCFIPQTTTSDLTFQYSSKAVQLALKLFFLQENFEAEKKLLETQKIQRDRKISTLERNYQEIMDENYQKHQIIQQKQHDYSTALQSEIRRQTAELRKAHEKLKIHSQFQQTILDTAATAIFTVDLEKNITNVNDEFCAITGYTKEEVLGKPCVFWNRTPV